MKKQTFADRAKQIVNKYKLRLGEDFDKGDVLALEAMNQELSLLRDEQEAERAKLLSKRRSLNTLDLPEHGGDTIDGSTLQVPYRKFYGYPENALTNSMAPWMLQNLYPKEFEIYQTPVIKKPVTQSVKPNISLTAKETAPLTVYPTYKGSDKYASGIPQNLGFINEGASKISIPKLALSNNKLAGINNILASDSSAGLNPFKSRVPWLGAVSGVVGNLLMNNKIDLPEYNPETYIPTKLSPNLVYYGRSREQILNERDLADNIILNNARGTGSQNALMENILAGKTATQRTAGQQFNASLENEGNVNAQILNDTDRMNAQLAADAVRINNQNQLYANQIKRENMMMNAERRDAKIQGITDSLVGYGKDRMAANQYDNMLQIMAPDNYKAVSGKDSVWRKIFGISPDMNMVLSKTDSMKKANGGYIGNIQLFGDDEYEKLMMRVNKGKDKKNALQI